MSKRTHIRISGSSLFSMILVISLLFGGITGCLQVNQLTPQSAPLESPTATSELTAPPGWETFTSQRCEYEISHPPEMQVTNQGAYSQILGYELSNPEEGARNFIYVSVIFNQPQSGDAEGVYNYDPAEAQILQNMQVGESRSVRNDPTTDPFYTYTRREDATIDGYAAKKFENTQPFEFPAGTKEIRYYTPVNECTFLIGGYVDTASSAQAGAITEDLFNQVVSTFQIVQ